MTVPTTQFETTLRLARLTVMMIVSSFAVDINVTWNYHPRCRGPQEGDWFYGAVLKYSSVVKQQQQEPRV